MARDPELTTRGARVLLLLLSHDDGYEVSQRSMAEQLECKRTVVDGALQDLVKARYIAVTPYRKHNGQRAYEEYHVNSGGKFTNAEIAEYAKEIILPAPNGNRRVAPNWDHKEQQPEDQVEEQVENQAPQQDPDLPDLNCEWCDTNDHGVCGLHLHDYPHKWHEAVEDSTETADAAPCNPSSRPNTMEANEKRCSVMACSNPLAPMSAYFCDDHLAKYGRKPGRDDDDEAGSHERADALLAHR